jgi:hypothetical protein
MVARLGAADSAYGDARDGVRTHCNVNRRLETRSAPLLACASPPNPPAIADSAERVRASATSAEPAPRFRSNATVCVTPDPRCRPRPLRLGPRQPIRPLLRPPPALPARTAAHPSKAAFEQAVVEESADRRSRRCAQRTVHRIEALVVHTLQGGDVIGQHPVERCALGEPEQVRRPAAGGAGRSSGSGCAMHRSLDRAVPGDGPGRRLLHAQHRRSRSVPSCAARSIQAADDVRPSHEIVTPYSWVSAGRPSTLP